MSLGPDGMVDFATADGRRTCIALALLQDASFTVEALSEWSEVPVETLLAWANGPGLIYGCRWAS